MVASLMYEFLVFVVAVRRRPTGTRFDCSGCKPTLSQVDAEKFLLLTIPQCPYQFRVPMIRQ
ncbi:hypothetical protein DF030_07010 [Burkholderia cenocepacia]|nr:hypothetical protein DF030_07010 [Burkholderia cenocepacia]